MPWRNTGKSSEGPLGQRLSMIWRRSPTDSLLLHLERRLAESITALPRADHSEYQKRTAFLTGLLASFIQRADAVAERLAGPTVH